MCSMKGRLAGLKETNSKAQVGSPSHPSSMYPGASAYYLAATNPLRLRRPCRPRLGLGRLQRRNGRRRPSRLTTRLPTCPSTNGRKRRKNRKKWKNLNSPNRNSGTSRTRRLKRRDFTICSYIHSVSCTVRRLVHSSPSEPGGGVRSGVR